MENYLESLALGESVKIGYLRKNERNERNFLMTPKCDPFQIKTKISPYERVDYIVVGGMVFTELTDQTLSAAFRVDPTLGSFLLPENRTKPRLILTHVFGHSQVFQNHTIGAGALLRRVNGEEVYTAEDVNRVVSKASTRRDFTFAFNHHRKVFLTAATMHEELKVIDDQNIHLNDGVKNWMKNWCTRNTKQTLMEMQEVVNKAMEEGPETPTQINEPTTPFDNSYETFSENKNMKGVSYLKTKPVIALDTNDALKEEVHETDKFELDQTEVKSEKERNDTFNVKTDEELNEYAQMDEFELNVLRSLLPQDYDI